MSRDVEPGSGARPVRVLTVLPADPERMRIGGIASFVRGFVKFAPPDFELGFVGMSASRPSWRWQPIALEGRSLQFLSVSRLPAAGRGAMPLALRFGLALGAGRRRLDTRDWILAFHRPATDLPLAGRPGPMWRVVHLAVDDLTSAQSESRWRPLGRPLAELESRSFSRMDHIYVVNEAAAHAYRARFPRVTDRIAFLPNWADPTLFHPAAAHERDALRANLLSEQQLPATSRILLFAGRLESQKDPLLLADALAELRADGTDASLLVAGEGSLEAALRDRLAARGALDAVRLLGTVARERLAQLMHASDLLVITSAFETGPTIGLEALACGLPVVTTGVGEVARLVERHGAGAVAVERTAASVAAALRSALAGDRAGLHQSAITAAAPHLADRVLGRLYDDNRLLAGRMERPL